MRKPTRKPIRDPEHGIVIWNDPDVDAAENTLNALLRSWFERHRQTFLVSDLELLVYQWTSCIAADLRLGEKLGRPRPVSAEPPDPDLSAPED